MHHPCITIYNLSNQPVYGNEEGICRITGIQSKGIKFSRWVRDTFTDFHNLKPGTIISNEAIFSFEEQSEYLQHLTGKDKPQRFRNYTHIVLKNKWHIKSKAEKEDILKLIIQLPEICVIAESGQRHLLFKHKPGTWQLEDTFIQPNVHLFAKIQSRIHALSETFSNDEIQSGQYLQHRILKFGFKNWQTVENTLKQYRGQSMFDLALFFSKIKYDYHANHTTAGGRRIIIPALPEP